MVRSQLKARNIHDAAVLDAMRTVPRHVFAGDNNVRAAYADRALPIGGGQTISQPYIVAFMTQALAAPEDGTVLEIGTGSGYQAAVLSRVVKRVITIERIESLSARAQKLFEELGYDNIECHVGDGTLGWPPDAPYDGILITAGGPRIPEPLKEQLAPNRHLIMPVGKSQRHQYLVRLTLLPGGTFQKERLSPVAFVPLIGEHGW
jgi:protein-L-isoaspartate(D-aspartate) O-methyltransferase